MIVVVKFGTSVLTGGTNRLDKAHMVELVRQCAGVQAAGHQLVLVTSGAVAAGREQLGWPALPDDLPHKQMLAAIGQGQLVHLWQHLFGLYGLQVGQMLLTRADLENRERYLNARDTLATLLQHGVIPLINENDAVATTEIKVGDNDNLSARVAIVAGAQLLLLLTDQRGLFTADPRACPDAKLIEEIQHIDASLQALAGNAGAQGTGGMVTKLQAADVARRGGIGVVIASGHHRDVIAGAIAGDKVGSRFLPVAERLESRKRWLLAGPPATATLQIDAGAGQALSERGASLLPSGLVAVQGQCQRGDAVTICCNGQRLGIGLVRYSSSELSKLAGQQSSAIENLLGFNCGPEVIHRDDFVLLQ